MGGAFIAGALAILSPGLAPLVPGYAALMAAGSLSHAGKGSLVAAAAGFIAAFSLTFIALGASATAVGQSLVAQLDFLSHLAGIILVLLGLFTIVFRARTGLPARLVAAILAGPAFAFGWTPTVDPTLATVLFAAAQPDSLGPGLVQLASYALGLATPLLLIALVVDAAVSRTGRYHRAIEIVFGAVIIGTGVLIFTNR